MLSGGRRAGGRYGVDSGSGGDGYDGNGGDNGTQRETHGRRTASNNATSWSDTSRLSQAAFMVCDGAEAVESGQRLGR